MEKQQKEIVNEQAMPLREKLEPLRENLENQKKALEGKRAELRSLETLDSVNKNRVETLKAPVFCATVALTLTMIG